MPALTGPIIVTTAGRAALLDGTFAPTEIALGSGSWSPTDASDTLLAEQARVDLGGQVDQIGDDARLHLTGVDDSALAYSWREFAIYDASATCLAIYSQATDIAVKASGSQLLVSFDFVVLDADPGTITVGDTTYDLPAATEGASGLVELATSAEVQLGTDTQRAITPAGLAARTATTTRTGIARLATSAEVIAGVVADAVVTVATLVDRVASTTLAGLVELATDAETQAGTDATRAVTPVGLASRTATESRTGLVELATSAEAQAGADTARAVTPSALAAVTATTARRGLVELATTGEAQAGSDATRAVTPAALAAVLGAYKARWSTRAVTVLIAAGVTRSEATFTGLIDNAAYIVTVTVHGYSDDSSVSAKLQIVGGPIVGWLQPFGDAGEQTITMQAAVDADGAGELIVQIENVSPVATARTLACTVSAVLAHG